MSETEVQPQRLALPDEAATARLAQALAPIFAPGDLITLAGDLGAGKTAFARHLIRHLTGNPGIEVTSPTFTLVQTYESPQGPIIHADLYRIGGPSELAETGWDEDAERSIVLVEWPDRAGDDLKAERLDIHFEINPDNPSAARFVTLRARGRWHQRLGRAIDIAGFLNEAGWGDARRAHLQGDASSRRYERLTGPKRSAILMDAPRKPDGPAIRDGRPYSQIAHLAEDVVPFAAMAQALRQEGFSAPAILASDFATGLLLIEDFGTQSIVIDGAHVPERIEMATDLLAELHARSLPTDVQIDDLIYQIPPYDLDALLIETELLLDWYLPHVGRAPSAGQRAEFLDIWKYVLAPIVEDETTWTLRDYHSPNLMWLPTRLGTSRIGLLDFQDTVIGHPAYDLVSLLQDARLDVADTMELSLLTRYAKSRVSTDNGFNPQAFANAYAVLGAQRATKILGIFVRLAVRDGKKNYLRHLPRILTYLERNLAHPGLLALRHWYIAALGEQ